MYVLLLLLLNFIYRYVNLCLPVLFSSLSNISVTSQFCDSFIYVTVKSNNRAVVSIPCFHLCEYNVNNQGIVTAG